MLHECRDSLHHLFGRLRLIEQVSLVGEIRAERDPSWNVGVQGTSDLSQGLSTDVALIESAPFRSHTHTGHVPELIRSAGVLQVGLMVRYCSPIEKSLTITRDRDVDS
jgi:hypothetical protein